MRMCILQLVSNGLMKLLRLRRISCVNFKGACNMWLNNKNARSIMCARTTRLWWLRQKKDTETPYMFLSG